LVTELALLTGLAAALFYFSRRPSGRVPQHEMRLPYTEGVEPRSLEWALAAVFAIALIVAIYRTVTTVYYQPHGGWDAWMSWNLRARFFFRAGEHWRDTFSNLFWGANPAYPVLLPSAVARSWLYAGRGTELAPALVAALFTFATVGLTYSSLRFLRSKGQALLAGLLLVSTPFFIKHGASQAADVPLGFFLLASIVLVCLHDRASPQRGLLCLVGLAAGFGAWTKNEGSLFVVALIIAMTSVLVPRDGLKACARQQAAFAAGLLVVLPIALYARFVLAPPEPMLAWERSRLHQLIEWRRYLQILRVFGREGLRFGEWPLQVTPLLAFYALLLGVDSKVRAKRSTIIGMGTMGLILAGYFVVFLTSREDLAWHLGVVNRLFLQLWPSAIFLFFLVVRTPEQALGDDPAGPEPGRRLVASAEAAVRGGG
jgi:4-amino-4-deoxy-L-arabinose transferase-like glycosyltransferase